MESKFVTTGIFSLSAGFYENQPQLPYVSTVHPFFLLSNIPWSGCPSLFPYSPIEGHPLCFQLLTIRIKAVIDSHVQVFV